jgi:hypothetical protein
VVEIIGGDDAPALVGGHGGRVGANACLDDNVLVSADQHQVLNVVAAHQHQKSRLVDFVIFRNAKTCTLARPDLAAECPNHDPGEQQQGEHHAGEVDPVEVRRDHFHVGLRAAGEAV